MQVVCSGTTAERLAGPLQESADLQISGPKRSWKNLSSHSATSGVDGPTGPLSDWVTLLYDGHHRVSDSATEDIPLYQIVPRGLEPRLLHFVTMERRTAEQVWKAWVKSHVFLSLFSHYRQTCVESHVFLSIFSMCSYHSFHTTPLNSI